MMVEGNSHAVVETGFLDSFVDRRQNFIGVRFTYAQLTRGAFLCRYIGESAGEGTQITKTFNLFRDFPAHCVFHLCASFFASISTPAARAWVMTLSALTTMGLSIILPSTARTPELFFRESWKAAKTFKALAICTSVGVKILWIASICFGWMQLLPSKPMSWMRLVSSLKPSMFFTSEKTVSRQAMSASRAAMKICTRQ